MRLDLRQDLEKVTAHLKRRVRDYPKYVNDGPGRDEDPISLITLGFEYEPTSWFALVFDTRAGATTDGHWQFHIEGNAVTFPAWGKAFAALCEANEPITVTRHDGSKTTLKPGAKAKEIAACFGEMLRNALLSVRNNGGFKNLPTADSCVLAVEHHEGAFGSIDNLDGSPSEPDDEEELLASIQGRLKSMSTSERIGYWIDQLELLANEQRCELSGLLFPDNAAFEALEAIGKKSVVPLLEFACRWAGRSEWKGDKPGKIEETAASTLVVKAIWNARDHLVKSREVKSLLLKFIRESVAANQGRKHWGVNPYHAADCLHDLFPKYPAPRKDDRTNALLNPQDYV